MRDRGPCWPRGTALPRASGPLCTPLLLEARIEGSRCPELVPAPAPQAGGSRVSHRQLSNELSLPSIGAQRLPQRPRLCASGRVLNARRRGWGLATAELGAGWPWMLMPQEQVAPGNGPSFHVDLPGGGRPPAGSPSHSAAGPRRLRSEPRRRSRLQSKQRSRFSYVQN